MKQKPRLKEAQKKYSYYSRWFNLLITGTSSGGFSIPRSLHFDAVVGPGSWAHMIYKETPLWPIHPASKYSTDMDHFIRLSQEAFMNGRARATDSLISDRFSEPVSIIEVSFAKFLG